MILLLISNFGCSIKLQSRSYDQNSTEPAPYTVDALLCHACHWYWSGMFRKLWWSRLPAIQSWMARVIGSTKGLARTWTLSIFGNDKSTMENRSCCLTDHYLRLWACFWAILLLFLEPVGTEAVWRCDEQSYCWSQEKMCAERSRKINNQEKGKTWTFSTAPLSLVFIGAENAIINMYGVPR